MNLREEQMWAEIVEASLPNPAELAAAEAELRAIEPVEPLPPAMVDAVVDRATATAEAEETPHEAPVYAFSQRKKMLLAAALLLVSVSGIAWAFLNRQWTEEKYAPRSLDYAEAVQLTTEPKRTSAVRLVAIGRIDEHCAHFVLALRELEASTDPELASAAKSVRKELRSVLTVLPDAPPRRVSAGFGEEVARLLDSTIDRTERLRTLESLRQQALSGFAAMAIGVRFLDEPNRVNFETIRQNLVRLLDD